LSITSSNIKLFSLIVLYNNQSAKFIESFCPFPEKELQTEWLNKIPVAEFAKIEVELHAKHVD